MQEIELSFQRLIKIWWGLAWRYLIFMALAGFVAGFLTPFLGLAASSYRDLVATLLLILCSVISICVSIWIIKSVITKRFSDFRIALILIPKPTTNDEAEGPIENRGERP